MKKNVLIFSGYQIRSSTSKSEVSGKILLQYRPKKDGKANIVKQVYETAK